MSTRSFIAKKTNGGFKGVYSHWDGYPKKPGVGWQLRKDYKLPSKVTKLINLGDISSLRKNIGRKHKFEDYEKAEKNEWTTVYHRDRGEPWKDVKPKSFKTIDALQNYASDVNAEYLYIYDKGRWKTIELPY